ncbi:XRE family transcriptional regulator [Parashewanella curva]|uniref:XRE family transcriptional regulator n=1 Tax=Parashewanella curva TaxID=2338552 RepID=A0A3L8PV14_9GAMM|nr:helix-turn-helix transcriptional regulator [Parashewanella curva]RLV59170.1 XRE family transcriptional regulator [Parashewanella curva]
MAIDSRVQFSQRLNQILDRHNYPPKNMGRIAMLAELFGITQKGAGNWLNGKAMPSRKMLKQISEHFKISQEWLILGKSDQEAAGQQKIPVLCQSKIHDYLEGKLTQFDKLINVKDNISSEAFAIDLRDNEFFVDFLISNNAILIFDPQMRPTDKLFAMIQTDNGLVIKNLIEFEKGQLAYTERNQQQRPELNMIDDKHVILAPLKEILFHNP